MAKAKQVPEKTGTPEGQADGGVQGGTAVEKTVNLDGVGKKTVDLGNGTVLTNY